MATPQQTAPARNLFKVRELYDAVFDAGAEYVPPGRHPALDAGNALFDEIMSGLADKVTAASREGKSEADVYTWQGEEPYEGISSLFLVRGPRKGSMRVPGFTGLLFRLRRALRPFVVFHTWDSSTHANRLVVSWRPARATPETDTTGEASEV